MIMSNQIEFLINEYLPEAIAKYAKRYPELSESNISYLDNDDIAYNMMEDVFESKVENSSYDEMANALIDYIYENRMKIENLIISFNNLYFH